MQYLIDVIDWSLCAVFTNVDNHQLIASIETARYRNSSSLSQVWIARGRDKELF